MDKHLINVDEFKQLARPTSNHIDTAQVEAFVRECEDMYIVPAIGYAKFKEAAEAANGKADELDEFQGILLNGGEYTDKDGKPNICKGLKTALAYFVYAKLARSDGSILARAGFMRHGDQYASHVEDATELKQYNDIMDIAEHYLNGCIQYINLHDGGNRKPVRGSRCHIHAIGD